MVALIANLPLVFPAAMSFSTDHLLHHRHIGELDVDARAFCPISASMFAARRLQTQPRQAADLAGPTEAGLVGRSRIAKALWLAAFTLVLGTVRPRRLTGVPLLDRWTVTNVFLQAGAMAAFVAVAGWPPVGYR